MRPGASGELRPVVADRAAPATQQVLTQRVLPLVEPYLLRAPPARCVRENFALFEQRVRRMVSVCADLCNVQGSIRVSRV